MDEINAVIDYVGEIADTKSLVGIILYGSTVHGGLDNHSDLDLALVTREGKLSYKYLEFRGRDLDILLVPEEYFEELVNEAVDRLSNSLWLTSSLYLKILFEGKILYDPYGRIRYLKKTVGSWQWTRNDIESAIEYLYENLDLAEELVDDNRLLEALIASTESINLMVSVYVLKDNGIPSPQPKDLYSNAVKYDIIEEFIVVHGLRDTEVLTRSTIELLKTVDNDIFVLRRWRRFLREMKRNKKSIALLEARNLAIMEAAVESNKPTPLPYIASQKVMIVSGLGEDRYRFLEKLYGVARKDSETIKQYIRIIDSLAASIRRQLQC